MPDIGATLNRLDSISKVQNLDIENLSNLNSIIMDTDIACETANLTKSQILQQVSASLFTHANSLNGGLVQRLLGL